MCESLADNLLRGIEVASVKLAAFTVLVLVAAVLVLPSPAARAVTAEYTATPVRRAVIAIYDSRSEPVPSATRIHQFVEMPLNWLGLTLTYVDVNGPLPRDFERYRGVVTWFVEPVAAADPYLAWADEATSRGLKLAVFANLAPGHSKAAAAAAARVHRRLGLASIDDFISVTHKIEVAVADPTMVGFERPLDRVLPEFQVMRLVDPVATVHLAVRLPGASDKSNAMPGASGQAPSRSRDSTPEPSILIVTGPGGGYASDNYTIAFEPVTDRVMWTLNPFEFLKRSLVPDRMPIPDVTTLSGRRVYFSHIDGDGWNNVSTIDGYRQTGAISADVIRREAIEPFPDLPVTIGVIAGDLLADYGALPAGPDIARKLFALPQVEVGSHTYSHPFDWGFFATYDRAREQGLFEKVSEPELALTRRAQRWLNGVGGLGASMGTDYRPATGSGDMPRTYAQRPFDLAQEVAGALALSEKLAPAGKKAKLYQWSGNCLPFERAIAATRAAGVRNMNGGDARFDSGYPSVFYLPPISKPVGNERQIYAANSNENTYTNDWTGPFFGFALLAETIRNTETPRRLKPFNLYYHMYSGEKESALAALLQNLQLARSMLLMPVAASRYAAMADDFFRVEIAQIGPRQWTLANRGEVQTVRFEAAEGLALDIEASVGVLGATRHSSGAMFVALDGAVPVATVTLRPEHARDAMAASAANVGEPAAAIAPSAKDQAVPVQLVSSRWLISGLQREACSFSFHAEGFGAGEMLFAAKPGQRYVLTASRAGRAVATAEATGDAAGIVDARIAADAIEPLHVRVECRE